MLQLRHFLSFSSGHFWPIWEEKSLCSHQQPADSHVAVYRLTMWLGSQMLCPQLSPFTGAFELKRPIYPVICWICLWKSFKASSCGFQPQGGRQTRKQTDTHSCESLLPHKFNVIVNVVRSVQRETPPVSLNRSVDTSYRGLLLVLKHKDIYSTALHFWENASSNIMHHRGFWLKMSLVIVYHASLGCSLLLSLNLLK